MSTKIIDKNGLTENACESYSTGFVTSKDGTSIGYRQFGHGPGLVLVQGAMGTAHHYQQLSELLADAFAIYVPDRRGRGLSDPTGDGYGVQKEVEDLDALLAKTGARYVFGLSSGALISLQAAMALPAIHKLAIYEPPFFMDGVPTHLLSRYESEMAEENIPGALITAMQATQMGPKIFNIVPHWLLEFLVNAAINNENKNGSGDYPSMTELAPTLRNDFQVVAEMNGKLASFKDLHTEVLLLGGSRSPAFLKSALDALEQILPHAKRIEFPQLGHSAAWNYDKQRNPTGNPKPVAQELCRFFVEP